MFDKVLPISYDLCYTVFLAMTYAIYVVFIHTFPLSSHLTYISYFSITCIFYIFSIFNLFLKKYICCKTNKIEGLNIFVLKKIVFLVIYYNLSRNIYFICFLIVTTDSDISPYKISLFVITNNI